ncbi:hypothetical protein [Sphingobacterium deserti]|uniref:Uncharacterized protein n=1 Tax=Sphingobacterium deserti TaxID=1229276 RepID=A0A0B8T063_9SPHI|nr:hypothetical protein [Sphingobacterium deserti]KGE13541.1 hypothetical protein DI53_2729 [Sphingobacterium deserti]
MNNQGKNIDDKTIYSDKEKDKSNEQKKEDQKHDKDEKGIDYIPPTPEPATDSSRRHDDPIRDHNPSVL